MKYIGHLNLLLLVLIAFSLNNQASAQDDVKQVNPVKIVPAQDDESAVEKPKKKPVEEVSPESALRKAHQEELEAMRAKEQLQYEETKTRDESERRRAELDRELTKKKKHIFELKQKEDQYAEEIQRMKFEISQLEGKNAEIQKDVDSAQKREMMQYEANAQVKLDLEHKKSQLATAIANLNKTREESSKKINSYLIQMQQARAESATSESSIARAENDKARAEAEELQLRTQWAALAAHAETMREEKERLISSVNDAKSRLEIARKDYQAMKIEAEKASKEKVAVEQESIKKKNEISAEMRKLEQDTSFAYTQKATAEAEKVRLAAEVDSLREKLAFVKKRNEESQQQIADSQGAVMESRLAFETAKAELTNALAEGETAKLRNDAKQVKMRSLASIAESSDMMEGHKPWVAMKDCKITRTPASTQETKGKIRAGDRVIAVPGPAGFVKILNTSGRPAYISSECGKFADE